MAKKFKDFIKKVQNAFVKEVRTHSGVPNFEMLYGGGVFEKISEQSAKADDFSDERPFLNTDN